MAANKNVAKAKESATSKDSLSDEMRDELDELWDVLIEKPFYSMESLGSQGAGCWWLY